MWYYPSIAAVRFFSFHFIVINLPFCRHEISVQQLLLIHSKYPQIALELVNKHFFFCFLSKSQWIKPPSHVHPESVHLASVIDKTVLYCSAVLSVHFEIYITSSFVPVNGQICWGYGKEVMREGESGGVAGERV